MNLEQLPLGQALEGAALGHQLIVSAGLGDPAVLQHDDAVDVADSAEPMGELFVEEGSLPGDDPLSLTGADGTIWHPEGRWAATVVRLCGGIAILDPEKNFEPAAFLQFNKDSQDQYPVEQIDKDTWKVVFDKIHSPGHEIGFSPDGKFLVMMNNLRENNCSIFSSSDPDPTKWRKVAHDLLGRERL